MIRPLISSRLSRTCLVSALALCIAAPALGGGSHTSVEYPAPRELKAANAAGIANVRGFGRLFPLASDDAGDLLPHSSPRYDLVRLGAAMIRADGDMPELGTMPAAHVFLGQFIDHDLTLDTVTSFDGLVTETELENARTVDLDLDCVYGGGPERTPHLYDGPYLRRGAIVADFADDAHDRFDLLRTPNAPSQENGDDAAATALIGDPRNDENFVIAQMQAAFVAYHNAMVDRLVDERLHEVDEIVVAALNELQAADSLVAARRSLMEGDAKFLQVAAAPTPRSKPTSGDVRAILFYVLDALLQSEGNGAALTDAVKDELREEVRAIARARLVDGEASTQLELLEEARALTIHHYHRVIAEDFLPRILGVRRVQTMAEHGRRFFFPTGFRNADGSVDEPFIPIEFAVAGYRFGHSQVPGRMALREEDGATVAATLFGPMGAQPDDLMPRGFTPVRPTGMPGHQSSLIIDWAMLTDISDATDHERARRLDETLSPPLGDLEGVGVVGRGALANLASRNLTRGRSFELPSGQDLARHILHGLKEQGVLSEAYGGEDTEEGVAALILEADETTAGTLGLRKTPLWYYLLQEAGAFGFTDDGNGSIPISLELGSEGLTTGATLGPVGGTIVGETLMGLMDHWREATGEGLDLNVPGSYALLADDGTADGEGLTETEASLGNETFGKRYLLRNLLFDAGVTAPLAEATICEASGTQPTDACN